MLGVLAVAALVGLALVSGGAASTTSPSAAVDDRLTPFLDPEPTTITTAGVTTTTTAPAASATTTSAAGTDPGTLPQTDQKPAASGATFAAGVQGLWRAVVQDDPQLAMPFFFPKRAYLQVKAISDPATDYEQRLIANYEQDIHALHSQLGANPGSAQFVGIDVPGDQAVLVQPGEESNTLSYWRVYGTTLRYSANGATNSFPVTSLISWRGEWYVVHLGEIR
jgi:hypothetical protein